MFSAPVNPQSLESCINKESARGAFIRGPERNMLDKAFEDSKREGLKTGIDQGFQSGYDDGLQQGRKAAFDQHEKQLAQVLESYTQQLQLSIDNLNRAVPVFFDDAEEAMANRAMEVVSSLLSHELVTDRSSVISIVREVLGEITLARHARIKVNPFDSALLNEKKAKLLSFSSSLREVEIVDDPAILGGCIIETEAGSLDATVNTRMNKLRVAYGESA